MELYQLPMAKNSGVDLFRIHLMNDESVNEKNKLGTFSSVGFVFIISLIEFCWPLLDGILLGLFDSDGLLFRGMDLK